MAQKTGNVKGRNSIFGQLLIGAGVCIIITLITAAVSALLVSKEIIGEKWIESIAIVILFLSSLTGAKTGSMGEKEKNLYISPVIGLVYVLIVLSATAIFFGGQYQSVGVGAIAVLSGCILSVILGQKQGNKGKIRRSKNRHR